MGDFEFLTKKSSKPVDMLNMRERAIRISRIKQKPELESSLNKSRFGIENKVAKRGKEHEENKEASASVLLISNRTGWPSLERSAIASIAGFEFCHRLAPEVASPRLETRDTALCPHYIVRTLSLKSRVEGECPLVFLPTPLIEHDGGKVLCSVLRHNTRVAASRKSKQRLMLLLSF